MRSGVAADVNQGNSRASTATLRAELSTRLRARRPEIEKATLTRVRAISGARELGDAAYQEGMRAAVSAALDHSLAVLESGADSVTQIPLALLVQARRAARNGVGLDTLLRRCFAGYAVLGDFLTQEGGGLLGETDLGQLNRSQAAAFDRLLDAVSEEYTRELRSRPTTADQRLAARIENLVNGELVDISDIGYDLDAHHLAMVAAGAGAKEVVRQLCAGLDGRLLLVSRGEAVWAWLGRREPFGADEAFRHFAKSWPRSLSLAMGEPDDGPGGWRLSHHQARAAIPIAVRGSEPVVRYADVTLLTAALRDETLAESLRRIFLEPLAEERDGGANLRATLRAYFSAGGNGSAAAAALGISRQTVNSHLRTAEQRIGRHIDQCTAELQTVLRLEELSNWRRGVPRSSQLQ